MNMPLVRVIFYVPVSRYLFPARQGNASMATIDGAVDCRFTPVPMEVSNLFSYLAVSGKV